MDTGLELFSDSETNYELYLFIIILHIHIMYLYYPIQWAPGTIGEDYMGISKDILSQILLQCTIRNKYISVKKKIVLDFMFSVLFK
jgi:hypothetical protein